MFEIISLGRMDFLMAVLNGLAILTADDGPAGYGGLIALGLLIGVVLALLRGIVTQRLELQWILAGWLLFMALFVPKVTVTVEDIYTGTTNTVANVPLGPAAIGSITSTVGITLAQAFETVFAYPSMTSAGYMDSLDLINSMRDVDYGSANDGAAGATVPNVDLQRTLREYLVKCLMKSISMGIAGVGPSWAALRESEDLVADIQVNTNIWPTTVYLSAADPAGQSMGCADAYAQISSFIRTQFYPAWQTYIGAQLGLTDTEAQMQEALDAIFGLGASAQTYMLNALIKREIDLAEIGYHASGGNDAGVLMRVQAMEQRRTQWAAEQSMWAEMARPAISFIEGFFYAATPLMGFMFCLGAPGITIFARYLLLAIWIQLWMPILAVCNLYITIAASSDLQRISGSGTSLLSMTGLESVWTETASWLAFGGNMVAATPLLTLILITGSYFALTRLTDRLGGADHVNERIQSPDTMAPAALASVGAMGMQTARFTSDPMHGTHATGVTSVLPSINLGSDIRASMQSAQTAQEQAVRDWTGSFSTGLDLRQQKSREQFISNLHSTALSGTYSQTDAVIERMARSAVQNEGVFRNLSQEDRDTLHAAIGVAIQRGDGITGRANIDQTLANMRSVSDTQRQEIAQRIERLVGTNTDELAQLAEKVEQDASNGVSSRFFSAMGVTDATQWSEAYRDSRSASESFERAASLAESAGLRQDLKIQAIGYQATRLGWDHDLLNLVARHRIDMTSVEENAGFWSRAGWMDHETARASAAALALAHGSHDVRMELAETLAAHGFGSPGVALGDPGGSTPVESRAPDRGFARDVLGPEVTRMDLDHGDVLRREVRTQLASEADLEARGSAAVQEFFVAKREGNSAKVDAAMSELDGIISAQRAHHYESTFEESRGLLKAWQDFDLAGQFGDFEINVNALREAGVAFNAARAATLEATGNPRAAAAAGLSASFRGYSKGFDEAVQAVHDRARQEARTMGLPDVAAHYYADQHTLWQERIDVSLARMFGRDQEFERRKADVKELLGQKGFQMLDRAATAEPVAKRFYLEGALSLYQRGAQVVQ